MYVFCSPWQGNIYRHSGVCFMLCNCVGPAVSSAGRYHWFRCLVPVASTNPWFGDPLPGMLHAPGRGRRIVGLVPSSLDGKWTARRMRRECFAPQAVWLSPSYRIRKVVEVLWGSPSVKVNRAHRVFLFAMCLVFAHVYVECLCR